ncbi:hypothetical protein [Parvularcula sp. IMCC14364]|uniref:hypothetical protein n=1 Tax=Parvularcula sp. IMCC14364 TaxID=3067902 RepID=UPI002741E6A5|nr:hypothetical protein [Parvularcula sp. IMCC14364]
MLIFTVHGTNAADLSDDGEQWWQKGSEFQKKLQSRISEPLHFFPFHWSGNNSEFERRGAALELLKHFETVENEGIPYGAIAHSHGGNVIADALRFSQIEFPAGGVSFDSEVKTKEPNLQNLHFWFTVGTPFINPIRSFFLLRMS